MGTVELIRRAKAAFVRLNFMQQLYRGAYRLGAPNREGFETITGVQTAGEPKQRDVYDSTFQDAVERLANAVYTGMFPHTSPWLNLGPGSAIPKDQKEELTEQLQYPTEIAVASLLQSNFYTEVHPFLIDLTFGTGAMQIEPDYKKGNSRWKAIPIYQLGLEEGENGTVGATFRKYKIAVRNILIDFPNAVIPPELQAQMDANKDGEIEFYSCVVPEINGNRTYSQYIVWPEGPGGAILDRRDFNENPVVVARWSVLTGEVYGRGPALKSTATAYSLNEAARLILIAANIGIFGMWTVTDDGINPDTFKLGAGALIPVDSNDRTNPSIQALPSVAQMDFGQFTQDDLRSQIKRNLSVDQLGNVEGPKATAFEIRERMGMVMQDLGAFFGRTNSEFTDPALSRHVNILGEVQKLPPIKVDGKLVTLRYTSPLARAQLVEELTSMRALREENALHADIDPTEAARLDRGAMQKRQAEITGLDMSYVRDDEAVQEIVNQIAEGQAAQAQIEESGDAPQ